MLFTSFFFSLFHFTSFLLVFFLSSISSRLLLVASPVSCFFIFFLVFVFIYFVCIISPSFSLSLLSSYYLLIFSFYFPFLPCVVFLPSSFAFFLSCVPVVSYSALFFAFVLSFPFLLPVIFYCYYIISLLPDLSLSLFMLFLFLYSPFISHSFIFYFFFLFLFFLVTDSAFLSFSSLICSCTLPLFFSSFFIAFGPSIIYLFSNICLFFLQLFLLFPITCITP